MKISKPILLGTTFLFTSALMAVAGGHGQKTIGQTTALIPEAGLATTELKDGQSGNTEFPFALNALALI